jgi:hypothetical protein
MDWKLWYRSLTREEKQAYAQRVGVARSYIENKLIYRVVTPRPDLLRRLADASLGRVSHNDVLHYFFIARESAA